MCVSVILRVVLSEATTPGRDEMKCNSQSSYELDYNEPKHLAQIRKTRAAIWSETLEGNSLVRVWWPGP